MVEALQGNDKIVTLIDGVVNRFKTKKYCELSKPYKNYFIFLMQIDTIDN